MSTEALCKFAEALQIFLTEQEYARQTRERIEVLELAGLSFAPDELEVHA